MTNNKCELQTRGDNGQLVVQGLQMESVTSYARVLEIIEQALAERAQAETLMNKTSSRSHWLVSMIPCIITYI